MCKNRPNCYNLNDEAYPLCIGIKDNDKCKYCNLYEDMTEPYDND